MKKKVISLVVDTDLTNAQIQQGLVHLEVKSRKRLGIMGGHFPKSLTARRVRVLDSD
jgi:hypothetical protein